jgi:hypothetical protein
MQTLLKQLQQLAPLAEAATPGPWREEMDYEDNWTPMILSNHGCIAIVEDINFGSSRQEDKEAYPDQMEDNAAFIAAARNVLTPENLTLIIGLLSNMGSSFETNRVLAKRQLEIQGILENDLLEDTKLFLISETINPTK